MAETRNPFKDTSFLVFASIAVIAGALCFAKGEGFFLKGVTPRFPWRWMCCRDWWQPFCWRASSSADAQGADP